MLTPHLFSPSLLPYFSRISNHQWCGPCKRYVAPLSTRDTILFFTAAIGICLSILFCVHSLRLCSIAPVYQELADKHPNAVFIKVDVDELADIASDQGIEAMPTFRIFKAGAKIFEMRGADPAGLTKAVAEHCA